MKIKNNGEHVIIQIQAVAVGCRREDGGGSRIRKVVAWLSSRLLRALFAVKDLSYHIVNC